MRHPPKPKAPGLTGRESPQTVVQSEHHSSAAVMNHSGFGQQLVSSGFQASTLGSRQPNGSPAPSVDVIIEELALHGFAFADRYRVAAALSSELERLLTEHGEPYAWRENSTADEIRVAPIQIRTAAPEALGCAIARKVYAGGILL